MYGAVVCPRCRKAVGADLERKTLSCAHCGSRIDLSRRRVFFKTEDQRQLAEGVRALTKKLADDPDVPVELKRPRKAVLDKPERKKVVLPIGQELPEPEFFDLLKARGVRDPEKELERMRASGRVVEVRPGTYSILADDPGDEH